VKSKHLSRNEHNELVLKLSEFEGEAVIGVVFFIAALVVRVFFIDSQIRTMNPDGFPNPRTLPSLYCYILMVMAVGMVISAFYRRKRAYGRKTYAFNLTGLRRIAVVLLIVLAATLAMYYLPYIPVNAVMLAILMLFLGQRNKFVIVGVSIVMPILVWCLFTYGLKLYMP